MRRLSFALILAIVFVFQTLSAAQEAPATQTPQLKRPMTFEDLMQMKRLGDTAVSPDGKWLAYSVTTVDLAQNTKTAELWLQAIAPSSDKSNKPIKLTIKQPENSNI